MYLNQNKTTESRNEIEREIPPLIGQLLACKHEQALFDLFYDIDPSPVNPFEDSVTQMKLVNYIEAQNCSIRKKCNNPCRHSN